MASARLAKVGNIRVRGLSEVFSSIVTRRHVISRVEAPTRTHRLTTVTTTTDERRGTGYYSQGAQCMVHITSASSTVTLQHLDKSSLRNSGSALTRSQLGVCDVVLGLHAVIAAHLRRLLRLYAKTPDNTSRKQPPESYIRSFATLPYIQPTWWVRGLAPDSGMSRGHCYDSSVRMLGNRRTRSFL